MLDGANKTEAIHMQTVKFSHHAQKRFVERFPRIVSEADNNGFKAIRNTYYSSTVNNSIKNDTMFMTHIYENHGYNDFTITVGDGVVFIVKERVVVTVLPAESYIGQRVITGTGAGYKKH